MATLARAYSQPGCGLDPGVREIRAGLNVEHARSGCLVRPPAARRGPRTDADRWPRGRPSGRRPGRSPHPVGDLQRVADAAGITLDDVYEPGALAAAREHADARVVVGNRGHDLTLDLPKSYSVLTAMADPETTEELEDVYLDAVRETVGAVQQWAGYGMRGHHGDGHRAERVDGTGLLGWMTVHRTARPSPGRPRTAPARAPDLREHGQGCGRQVVDGTDRGCQCAGAASSFSSMVPDRKVAAVMPAPTTKMPMATQNTVW